VIQHCLPTSDPTPGNNAAWLQDCSGVMSKENTPIFPSYVFTPGTVVEYFYRCAYNSNLNGPVLFPDTTVINSLGSRYLLWRVLPDAWKDNAHYGMAAWDPAQPGQTAAWTGDPTTSVIHHQRACVLFDDHSYGLSQAYYPYHGAFDSLGINVDDYTSQAPSSGESGIGNAVCGLANATYSFFGSSGPSVNQLSGYYEVYYNCTALAAPSIADGSTADQDASADVELFDNWLAINDSHHRFLWLNGTSIALALDVIRPDGGPSQVFANSTLGIAQNTVDNNDPSGATNYRTLTNDHNDCPTIVAGSAPWTALQQTAVTGNLCFFNYDVIPPNTGLGAASSQLYQIGNKSAGVIHTLANGSKTLIDALDFPQVRNVSCHDSYGRIYQLRTVYYHYAVTGSTPFCSFAGGVQTGVGNRSFVNSLAQNSPNPFRPSRSTAIHYSVARTAPVNLTIHDVTGRTVRTLVNKSVDGGDYTASFDGRDDRGNALSAGVYFYRLKIGDFESNKKMLMLK